MKTVIPENALFIGDNGRCFCSKHAGMSARYTGRDISGQKIVMVTKAVLAQCQREGWTPACETCTHDNRSE